MNREDISKKVIETYQADEKMMVLVYAQWCINNGLDPIALYRKAYPHQADNPVLTEAMELTVPKEEAGPIENETVMGVLSLFGNDDLAFVVAEEIQNLQKRNTSRGRDTSEDSSRH